MAESVLDFNQRVHLHHEKMLAMEAQIGRIEDALRPRENHTLEREMSAAERASRGKLDDCAKNIGETLQWRKAYADAEIQKRILFTSECSETGVAWIKLSYLRELDGKPMPRFQDINECHKIIGAPPSKSTWWVISHAWLAKEHADVTGEQVAEVLKELDALNAANSDVVFYDYGSMFQRNLFGEDDRTEEQKVAFKRQLKMINMLFSTDLCKAVVVNTIPDSATRNSCMKYETTVHYQEQKFTVTPNSVPYETRGWCFFEFVVVLLFCTVANLGIRHEAALHEVFENMFNMATFTDPAVRVSLVHQVAELIATFNCKERFAQKEKELEDALSQGHLRLVRFDYLCKLASQEGVLPRRQDCPPEAFGDTSLLVNRFSISWLWDGEHADPKGVKLNIIVERLLKLGVRGADQVFIDWASRYQHPRTEAEQESHSKQHTNQRICFAGKRFRTVVITQSENPVAYHTKAWTLADLVIAAFSGTLIYDDPAVMEIMVEKFFITNLKRKSFTAGKADENIVAELFKSLLYERAGLMAVHCGKDTQIQDLQKELRTRTELLGSPM